MAKHIFGDYEDLLTIQRVLAEKGLVLVSLEEAEEIWSNYSSSMCAGWMGLPADEHELLSIVYDEAVKRAEE